ncbi:hypothetical protein ACFODZ_03890 [Marinicella sediminis]|uniref:DUF1772 domain-containing protein n=1 Tax=Marinicella sediminis TaxID=1792834 RepID=A0ABV7J5C7_9GAMM|nr:hypothetical protein [Marinicella sediminis]
MPVNGGVFMQNFLRLTYKPGVYCYIFFMIAISFLAVSIKIYQSLDLMEPDWFRHIPAMLSPLADVLKAAELAEYSFITSFLTALAAIYMGYFLRQCGRQKHQFEMVIVIILMVCLLLQILVLMMFPNQPELKYEMVLVNGDTLIPTLVETLKKTTNTAIVILAAALGIQLNSKQSGERDEPQS